MEKDNPIKRIEDTLTLLWSYGFREKFSKGYIIYERQFQAELYHHLNVMLYPEYNVWIEPVIYLDGGKKKMIPDIVITHNNDILSFMEIKWKPWERVGFKHDIDKLKLIDDLARENRKLQLGSKPLSPSMQEQKIREEKNSSKLVYDLSQNLLCVYVVFAFPGSNALDLREKDTPRNFLHLTGYFTNEKDIIFNSKGLTFP